ncbi:hypothetical protein BDR22DRAFT_872558 [Usnea florida]
MHPTRLVLARAPMIKFLGKRVPPKTITPAAPANEPAPHPASPSHSLPDSFITYRSKAQQHGPLAGHGRPSSSPSSSSQSSAPPPSFAASTSHAYGGVGGRSGHEFGSVRPDEGRGEVWDRSELPGRFGRMPWTEDEIEAVELGGANLRVGWGGS